MRSLLVKKKSFPTEATDDAAAVAFDAEEICGDEADAGGVQADARLAKRCLAGEVSAWEEFYAQCHDPLLVSVRIMLGAQGNDANLVDEIAARVWYALVANDGELLSRYKPQRGARLITFMRALARDEMVRYFRTEIRRRKRELAATPRESQCQGDFSSPSVNALAEFLATLAPQEQVFCGDYLLAEPSGAAEQQYSKANIWQLTHRIRSKLLKFLDLR